MPGKRVGALLGFPSLLVWDTFCCHLADCLKKLLHESHTALIVIPRGETLQLQLLHVCINKSLIDRMKHCYIVRIRLMYPEVTTPNG